MDSSSNSSSSSSSSSSSDNNAISEGQKREEKLRADFLKNSVKDVNTLYESLGKSGRGMRIRPEGEYWIFSAKPEKSDSNSKER